MEKKTIEMTLGEIVSACQTFSELAVTSGLKPIHKYKIAMFSIPFMERSTRINETMNELIREHLGPDENEITDAKIMAKVSRHKTDLLLTKETFEYCGEIELSWLGEKETSVNLFPIIKFIKQ